MTREEALAWAGIVACFGLLVCVTLLVKAFPWIFLGPLLIW